MNTEEGDNQEDMRIMQGLYFVGSVTRQLRPDTAVGNNL